MIPSESTTNRAQMSDITGPTAPKRRPGKSFCQLLVNYARAVVVTQRVLYRISLLHLITHPKLLPITIRHSGLDTEKTSYLRAHIAIIRDMVAAMASMPYRCIPAIARLQIGRVGGILTFADADAFVTGNARQVEVPSFAEHIKRQRLTLDGITLAFFVFNYALLEVLYKEIAPWKGSQGAGLVHVLDSIRNSYVDINSFLVQASPLREILGRDQSNEFEQCDDATKVLYFDACARIGAATGFPEEEVARTAVQLYSRSNGSGSLAYYLLGDGRQLLTQALGVGQIDFGHPLELSRYIFANGAITILTGCLIFFLFARASERVVFALVIIAVLIPVVSDFSNRAVDVFLFVRYGPRRLPRVDVTGGLPPEGKTVVAVPTVFTSLEHVRALVERIERHHLATFDPLVYYAVLSDWPESPHRDPTPEETSMLETCMAKLTELNRKYSAGLSPRFMLLHRHRSQLPGEDTWIGRDRKRGKVMMLLDITVEGQNRFDVTLGDITVLDDARYLLLLDDNTSLGATSVHMLLGTALHPSNRVTTPDLSPESHSCYIVLQPFPCVSLGSASHWGWLKPILESYCDPDAPPPFVRSVNFDSLGESAFYGKGLLHIRSFHNAVRNAIPENRVISHDILEGGLARTGYVGDVCLVEQGPRRLSEYYLRSHRWARGDWQNLILLLSSVLSPTNNKLSRISPFARYVIFHFVRRTMNPISSLLVLLYCIWFNSSELTCAVVLLALYVGPDYCHSVLEITLAALSGNLLLLRDYVVGRIIYTHLRLFCALILLPQQAAVMTDAALRGIWRSISRRRLLEWHVSSLDPARRSRSLLIDSCAVCFPGLLLAALAARAWRTGETLEWLLVILWLGGIIVYISFEFNSLAFIRGKEGSL